MMQTSSGVTCGPAALRRSFLVAAPESARSATTATATRDRWRIEAAFCRLKDFRRVATRYDKLAANFGSAVALASIVAFWA